MKKNLLIIALMLMCVFASAQQKPKPKEKDKPPTQKEMEEMMKEMQKEMDDMSPEDKKMMDSMGIKMPSMKNIPKVTDKQLADAWENENRIVPNKDLTRIGSISKTPLTNAAMPSYLLTSHSSVVAQLKSASKSKGEEIYKLIKTQNNSPVATGNTAASLWMLGKAELALYVMGKACLDNPTNTDNLNNYAAMLSMSGAEQLSIPIFEKINRQYPKNSTILNNMGQAWFGLGDIDKATKYLDSTVRIYAYHPQANFTKSFIEESKGNTPAAVECMRKSIKHAYSKEKEDRLRKMGHELKGKDLSFPFKPNPNPLNLSSFQHPDFPASVDESIVLEKLWKKFQEDCATQSQILSSRLVQAEQVWKKAYEQRVNENIALVKNSVNSGYVTGNLDLVPFHAPKALVKLNEITDGNDGYTFRVTKALQDVTAHMMSIGPLKEKYEAQIDILNKADLEQTGEGLPNKDFCPQKKAVADAFLSAYNPGLQKKWETYLDITRRRLNEEIYWYQFIQWPEQFETTKLKYELAWLKVISDVHFESITQYKCQTKLPSKSGGKLAEFDDVHCDYHSQLSTPVGTIKTDCSRMTTQLDLKFIKLGLKQDMNKETFNDQFMSCSVEVGVSAGAGIKNGPLKAEASVGAAVGVEFDRGGLKDVVVKVNAGVSVGTDVIEGGSMAGVGVGDLSADAGVQGQVSLISGKSFTESTGLLQEVFKR
jgi:tetratricopeptide (TPR) repeat protein